MSRCGTCRSKGDCEEWCGLDVNDLFEKNQKLQAQLDEANETIKFYGDKENWLYDTFVNSDDYESKTPKYWSNVCGKRARNYLEKYKSVNSIEKDEK
jgi:hypothetical protein